MVNKISYQKCFVAYLDILGFKERVINSENNREGISLLLDSLKICNIFDSRNKKATNDTGKYRTINIQSRFFSDSLVFFLEVNPDDLSHLFLIIRYLQDRLWEKELLIRGAVVYGDIYLPKGKEERNITLGPAIIKAYELESKVAIYPRVVIDKDLYDYIDAKSIKAYPFGGERDKLKNYIRKDRDGIYFLDLLNKNVIRKKDEYLRKNNNIFSIVWDSDRENQYDKILSAVDRCIENNIHSDDETIRQKYEWLKTYKKQSENGYI